MAATAKVPSAQPELFDVTTIHETWEMEYCPSCRSNWGANHGLKFKLEIYKEHALQPDGRCLKMHQHNRQEPYYTIDQMKRTRDILYTPDQIILIDFRTRAAGVTP